MEYDEQTAREVIASLVIGTLIAGGVLVMRHWNDVRCYLPALPRVTVPDQRSPTPLPSDTPFPPAPETDAR